MIGYFRPRDLEEALAIRATRAVLPLAGGTDVYPARANRVAWGEPSHADVLDLSAVGGLDAIEASAAGWRFGCLVTWAQLRDAALPSLFDGLRAAAREIGGRQVQTRGTLVGNLCTASPAGDGIPALLALDASVELARRDGRRVLPLAAFLTGYRQTACAADELVTALLVPRLEGGRGAFVKLGARRYLVISIAMASAVLAVDAAGRVLTARIAVGACSAVAQRLPGLEHALLGTPLAAAAAVPRREHLAALSPLDDVRASAAYREAAALQVTADALRAIAMGAA